MDHAFEVYSLFTHKYFTAVSESSWLGAPITTYSTWTKYQQKNLQDYTRITYVHDQYILSIGLHLSSEHVNRTHRCPTIHIRLYLWILLPTPPTQTNRTWYVFPPRLHSRKTTAKLLPTLILLSQSYTHKNSKLGEPVCSGSQRQKYSRGNLTTEMSRATRWVGGAINVSSKRTRRTVK